MCKLSADSESAAREEYRIFHEILNQQGLMVGSFFKAPLAISLSLETAEIGMRWSSNSSCIFGSELNRSTTASLCSGRSSITRREARTEST